MDIVVWRMFARSRGDRIIKLLRVVCLTLAARARSLFASKDRFCCFGSVDACGGESCTA